jgi:predicted dehydrogenase
MTGLDHAFLRALARRVAALVGALLGAHATAQTLAEAPPAPLRIVVIGMTHGHVEGLLWQAKERADLEIVGVYEPDRALFDRLAAKYSLDPALHFSDLGRMLDETKPEAASVMNSIRQHLGAVEACAPRGVHVLVEKPLAFSNADAQRMAALAREHKTLVLTNYETSWYASVRETKALIDREMFPVRRMVFRHGHRGPREIGCSEEFLAWLTDPEENGGGAIVDFGCYGAVLSTWLMNGERPTSVTASASTLKPGTYPRVDDDATIVLTYPSATAVIQASWAWTHDNKEMDVHTEKGSIHAAKWDELTVRAPDKPAAKVTPPPLPIRDEWTYLRKVIRGETGVDPLSSLETNLIVVEILDSARAAVRE